MTWREWMAARQLLTEEFLGVYLRQRQHDEDKQWKQTASNVRRETHGPR